MTSKIKLIIYTEDALLGSDSSGKGISKAFLDFIHILIKATFCFWSLNLTFFYSRRDFQILISISCEYTFNLYLFCSYFLNPSFFFISLTKLFSIYSYMAVFNIFQSHYISL